MKYRWKDGKAQAIAYAPQLNKFAVVKEANSLHELYGDEDGDEDGDDDDDDTDEDEED